MTLVPKGEDEDDADDDDVNDDEKKIKKIGKSKRLREAKRIK